MSDLHFSRFTLNLRLRELRRDDAVLPLPGKAFDLLSYMASNPGRPLLKAELLDAVWPQTMVEEANLSQTVFLLRKVMGSADGGLIKTLPGRGYQFAADVVRLQSPFSADRVQQPFESFAVETTQTRVVARHDVEEHLDLRRLWQGTLGRTVLAVAVVVALGCGWLGREYWLDRSGGAPVQVVVAPMDGTTGDPMLDKSLTQVLRLDLAQSPYVSLVSSATVRSTMTQMMHKPEDTLTPAIAREVCERTNSQSVLSGNIQKVGKHFLVMEEATSCVNGSIVGTAKSEADSLEELPRSIGKIAASLRQTLGESRRSVARFDTPLVPMNTASLEALKDYTQASLFMAQGKLPEAIALQKAALSLDPAFAAAQYDLGAAYLSSGDFERGRVEIRKAYELRTGASQPVRLAIIATYQAYCTQDLLAAEQNYLGWTAMYPRSPQAWNGLSNVERDLGHHAESAAAGLKAIQFAPTFAGLYQNAAFEQMRAGDSRGAIATLNSAITHHLDGDRVHEMYLRAARLTSNSLLMQEQLVWIDAHPDAAYSHLQLAVIAMDEGRFLESRRILLGVTALLRQQGLSGFADSITRIEAANLILAGDREGGISLFHSVAFNPEDADGLQVMATTGDAKPAEAAVKRMLDKYPDGTEWHHYWGPQVEASIALSSHDPARAITELEAVRPLGGRGLDAQKMRGDAYLEVGQPELAEKEYRENIAHRERDPESPAYPLSCLGLGRALAAEGRKEEAADAYRRFLTLWANADPDALFLRQAKQELAQL